MAAMFAHLRNKQHMGQSICFLLFPCTIRNQDYHILSCCSELKTLSIISHHQISQEQGRHDGMRLIRVASPAVWSRAELWSAITEATIMGPLRDFPPQTSKLCYFSKSQGHQDRFVMMYIYIYISLFFLYLFIHSFIHVCVYICV